MSMSSLSLSRSGHGSGHGHGPPSPTSLLKNMQQDPFLADFTDSAFEASTFACRIVAHSSPAPDANVSSYGSQAEHTLDAISSGIDKIEKAIKAHVLANDEELLDGVGGVSDLSARCEGLRLSARDLQRSLTKIRRDVIEPYEGAHLRTTQLHNVQVAGTLLKRLLRLLGELRKLRPLDEALGLSADWKGAASPAVTLTGVDLQELAKAAQSMRELEAIMADGEMAGISIVESNRHYVSNVAASVRRQAAEVLSRGLVTPNQADVAGALQVFYNLNCLADRVKSCIARLCDRADAAIAKALDPMTLSELDKATAAPQATGGTQGVGGTPGGTGAGSKTVGGGGTRLSATAAAARRRRAELREHVEDLCGALYVCSTQAWDLQQVLAKKQDAVTHRNFLQVVMSNETAGLSVGVYDAYWAGLVKALRDNLERAAAATSVVSETSPSPQQTTAVTARRELLVQLYPPLYKGALQLLKRLETTVAGAASETALQSQLPSRRDGAHGINGPPSAGFLGGTSLLSLVWPASEDISGDSDDDVMERIGIKGDKGHGASNGTAAGAGDGVSVKARAAEEAIINGLKPLEDLFLSHSMNRLTKPVELMFAHNDGYLVSVPSRHDLGSFVKAIQAEIDLVSTSGGGHVSLIPKVLHGVTAAVKLFCSKMESMRRTSDAALTVTMGAVSSGNTGSDGINKFDGASAPVTPSNAQLLAGANVTGSGGGGENRGAQAGGSWGRTADQTHNTQLLQLAAQLRSSLLALAEVMRKDHGGSVSVPTVNGADGGGSGSTGAGDEAAMLKCCDEEFTMSQSALEDLACDKIVTPYIAAIAAALEGIIARMHVDNFGIGSAGQGKADRDEVGAAGSPFLAEFEAALNAIQAEHLNPLMMAATNTQWVTRPLRQMAERLIRAYVSHASLVRPLKEEGRLKMTRDMAMLELAMTPLAGSTLPPAFAELRACRQLVFIDLEHGQDAAAFLSEPCTRHLRPSTALHYLVGRCPVQLASPHTLVNRTAPTSPKSRSRAATAPSQALSQTLYVQWLIGGGASTDWKAAESSADADKASLNSTSSPALLPDVSYFAEAEAWKAIRKSVDVYRQRMSAGEVAVQSSDDAAVKLLEGVGPALLVEYKRRCE